MPVDSHTSRRNHALKPLSLALLLLAAPRTGAASFQEDFSADPATDGWRILGQTNLFHWNATNHNLEVTWDSSQPNSCFYHPLGTILNRFDNFGLVLDLRLDWVAAGVNPTKPSTFPLSFGFLNLDDITRTNFLRGSGYNSPNLVEFAFFPQAVDISPTVWPSIWSTNSSLSYNGSGDYTLLDLPVGLTMHIVMNYNAAAQSLTTTVTTNGVSIGDINPVVISPAFTDFHAGAFALESYSDAGQNSRFGGSLLATGVVSHVEVTVPPPPVQAIAGGFDNGLWQVRFASRTNWLYTLMRAANLQSWSAASLPASGNGTNLVLQDATGLAPSALYRVRAERP